MFYVYLLASKPFGTLYAGSTSDLLRRVWEHKNRLVWLETHETMEGARLRERQIKEWKRAWKIELIERDNPHWVDLYPSFSLRVGE